MTTVGGLCKLVEASRELVLREGARKMLFDFELDALEAEVNGVSMDENAGEEEETWFDQPYFSWEMHDFFELDHRAGYSYQFQAHYSSDKHPHNYSIPQIKALMGVNR